MPYRPPSHVRYRVIDGEAILVNQKAAEVLGLDEVGTRVFELLSKTGELATVIDQLETEFAVDRKTLEQEVQSFVEELCAAGVLEAVSEVP